MVSRRHYPLFLTPFMSVFMYAGAGQYGRTFCCGSRLHRRHKNALHAQQRKNIWTHRFR
ncbi:MAG: hypothetical protein ACTTKL_04020 [Treponema sp.]